MTRRQRILHRLTWLLVATIGAIAFTASFEAIADYAGQVGWGPHMKYAAPLLVDTFTVAAGLVILARADDRERAIYAWSLLIVASGVSIGLNIADAGKEAPDQIVAALPPAALLAAVELVMSEARRARRSRRPALEMSLLSAEAALWAGRAEVLARHARTIGYTTTSEAGGRRPRQVGQEREAGPTTTPPAPAAKSAAAPARSGVAPTAPERVTKPGRDWSADLKSIERRRLIRTQLAEDINRSANKIKPALRGGVGVGDSTAFYALVEEVRSEMKQESNGAPERERVGS